MAAAPAAKRLWLPRAARVATAAGLSAAAGAAGAWIWSQPTFDSIPTPHAAINEEQCSLLRKTPHGRRVPPARNPGARTFAGFLSDEECAELLKELQPLKQQYGINLIEPAHAAIYRRGMPPNATTMGSVRARGTALRSWQLRMEPHTENLHIVPCSKPRRPCTASWGVAASPMVGDRLPACSSPRPPCPGLPPRYRCASNRIAPSPTPGGR